MATVQLGAQHGIMGAWEAGDGVLGSGCEAVAGEASACGMGTMVCSVARMPFWEGTIV